MLFYFNLFASPLLLPTKVYTLYTFYPESSFRIHKKTRLPNPHPNKKTKSHLLSPSEQMKGWEIALNDGLSCCSMFNTSEQR